MIQEDKARKYDVALEKARQEYNTIENVERKQWLEELFPELKESADEKIRKTLIKFHKSTIDIDGIKGDDIVAWLEKQGEQKPKWKQSDNIRFSQLYDFLVNKTPRLQVDCNEYAAWLNSLKQRMQ